MGRPFGLGPHADGSGTTPLDMQRIIGAQYHTTGILPSGGLNVTGTSSMQYKVEAGALFMYTSSAAKRGILVPVEETMINTDPAPATGSRIDLIYVDGAGAVRLANADTPPSGVAIAKFTVPAGITATTSAQQSIDRNFAIPAGSSLGRLHHFHDPANGTWGNISPIRLGNGRFYLPSDRLVKFELTWCSSAEPAGTDQTTSGVARWFVYVNSTNGANQSFARNWHYQGVHPTTHHQSVTLSLREGVHEVYYIQERMHGARFRHHMGGPDGWLGNRFEVWDAGVAR